MLPVHSTEITVLRDAGDPYAEPYGEPDLQEVTTGIRAVIDVPLGRAAGGEDRAGGEQTKTQLRLMCDLTDLRVSDLVRDERADIVYRVTWKTAYLTGTAEEHIQAGLELVEGLV